MLTPPDKDLPNARVAKRDLAKKFLAANIPFPDADALELVMAATGLDEAGLILKGNLSLPPEIIAKLADYSKRRLSGEPVDHILGWREFYGRKFKVSKDVLSPRADTETLIEHTLAAMKDMDAPRILDLGTGSGAILITCLLERNDARGDGVDISPAALDIAQTNASALGVDKRAQWHCGNWFTPLSKDTQYDIIISNPPYITPDAMQSLEREVKDYDPHIALQGGDDGLEAYRHILSHAKNWLAPNGWIGVEIGFDQDKAVRNIFGAEGFVEIQSHRDLGGNDRVVCAITNS